MSPSPLERVLQRHRAKNDDQQFKQGQRRENFDSKLSKVIPAFLDKVERTSGQTDAPFMFPLSGDDLIVQYQGKPRPAWYLASDYSDGQRAVYLLGDGTVVAHTDLSDMNVTDFAFADAGNNLTERAVKRLKQYLATSDESFKPLGDSWGRMMYERADELSNK